MRLMILADANSTHTRRWVTSLSTHMDAVLLLSLQKSNDFQFPENVIVGGLVLPLPNDKISISKIQYLKLVKIAKRKIKEFKPDILHAYYSSSYGLIGALTHFSPFIISIWGSDIFQFPKASFINKIITNFNFSKAQVLQATSIAIAKESANYTSKKIEIIPFGIDTNKFYPKDKVSDEIIIGTVKWMKEIYGISTLIHAFNLTLKKVNNKKIKLLLVGDGPEIEKYKGICKALNIYHLVEFSGYIPHDETPEYYQKMDIFATLSNSESFGVSVIEAAACGVPAVVSNVGGLPEVVQHEFSGIIVKPDDPEAASEAFAELINDDSKRKRFSTNGLKFVSENYRWEDNVRMQLKIYKEIV